MNIPFNERFQFFKASVRKNSGPLLIGLLFIVVGIVLMYLGYFVADNNFLTGFGFTFFSFSGSFLLYTMPSSFKHYYEQEVTKTYGSYTTAKVINKRVEDYSHTSNTFEGGQPKHYEEYLYAVEFEFSYNNTTYTNACFIDDKALFDAITLDTELPIQFLRHQPEKVTLRARKLSNTLKSKQPPRH